MLSSNGLSLATGLLAIAIFTNPTTAPSPHLYRLALLNLDLNRIVPQLDLDGLSVIKQPTSIVLIWPRQELDNLPNFHAVNLILISNTNRPPPLNRRLLRQRRHMRRCSCFSRFGWCGNFKMYCGAGCQPLFAKCNGVAPPSSSSSAASQPTNRGGYPISQDGSCGVGVMKACAGSACCSVWGWCGFDALYCGTGYCQAGFGNGS